MPTSIADCAHLLAEQGLRHHVDLDDAVIRLVFVTRQYRNLRGEKLVVMSIEAPDDGRRVRASIARAFAVGTDPAAVCLAGCRLAADTPLVAVEFDSDFDDLRLVVETAVEDGALSQMQLVSMIDRLVEAAEAWAPSMAAREAYPSRRGAA
ncbi:MAG: hypothetical protein WCR51_06470 [Planctomycetia bacterium]